MEGIREELRITGEKLYAAAKTGNAANFLETLQNDPTLLKTATIALVIGFLTLLLVSMVTRRLIQTKKQVVLLVGPSNSGKTTLFSKLTGSDWIGTVPSQTANYGSLGVIGKSDYSHVQLVDLPGNPALAYHILPHLKNATLIVFMFDASQFTEDLPDIASKMCIILDYSRFKEGRIPMLIAANKADLGSRCSTDKFIRRMMQKEIGAVKARESGGKNGQSFEFDSLIAPITLSTTSVILEDGLGALNAILKKYLK